MTTERLPIEEDGGRASHLAVRLEPPATGGEPRGWILYLHGFRADQAGEKAAFFRQRATAAGFAFGSLDFRGHGESGGSITELTPSRNLEDIALAQRWLRQQGAPERLILVGSSMGAGAALWHAALHPERVAAALLISPALETGPRLEAWAGREGLDEWQRTGHRRWQDEKGEVELGWAMIEDLRRYPLDHLAERLATPSLVLQGLQDTSVGWRGALRLFETCASGQVELHLFADADHRLADRLDRLWKLMREFLDGRQIGAGD